MRIPVTSITVLFLALTTVFFLTTGCGSSNTVVIYTSVDQDYAEPVINAFQSGNPEIEVKAIYDSEVTKTTGLYERILHEKRNPQADVFWNNEIIRTVQLKQQDLLAQYQSPSASDIPSEFKDKEGYWTGFSARARVMIINKDIVPETETPSEVPALGSPKYSRRTGMANPQFGTTAGHMAALYTLAGPQRFTLWFSGYIQNGLRILPGNATVRDQVAQGQLAFGLTDTDDAFAAMEENKPVRMAYLGQESDGTFLIPNTVALIKDSPNPELGKKLVDYLLSPEVEEKLAFSRGRQIPVRAGIKRPENLPPNLAEIKAMPVDYEEVAKNLEPCLDTIRQFIQ